MAKKRQRKPEVSAQELAGDLNHARSFFRVLIEKHFMHNIHDLFGPLVEPCWRCMLCGASAFGAWVHIVHVGRCPLRHYGEVRDRMLRVQKVLNAQAAQVARRTAATPDDQEWDFSVDEV